MEHLTRNDLQYIIGALNNAAEVYSKAVETARESGLKRIYGMQQERNEHLAAVLTKALETGSRQIRIDA